MRRWLPAVIAGLLVVAVSCGDDDTASTTTTEASTTSTTAVETTTTAETTAVPPDTTPPTTTAAVDPGIPTDPEAYAVAFVEAWEQGDHDRALQLGTATAVDTIFAYESGGAGGWSLVQCEGAAGSSYCTFTAGGDPTVVVRVGNEAASQGAEGAVTEVQVDS
jgi:hypothetical protein